MRYLSVCSGIEAASVAWHDLGWQPIGFSEIERFPSQVLETRFPGVRNYGDMTRFKEWDIERGTVDILVGGTPCQAFSVAGLRKGLADPRGNLALTFVAMVDHYRPEWVVWENVPGVLSSNGGRDFGSFLGALGQLGYGWCYRVLDAQYFGVAQRRRRVFVVAHSSGDPRRAAEVLFEPESLRGDSPPSREAGQGIASGAIAGTVSSKWAKGTGGPAGDECYNLTAVYESHPNDSRVTGPVEQCPTVSARWGTGGNNTPRVQQPMCLMDQGGSVMQVNTDGTTGTLRRETHGHEPVVVVQQPMAFQSKASSTNSRVTGPVEQCPTVSARWGTGGNNTPLVTDGEVSAFTYSGYSNQPAWMTGSRTDCLSASGHSDGSHQGIGIVQTGEASAFSWQSRGDMRGMVPRPTAQLQRCQIEAVMVPDVAHTLRGASFDAGEDGTGRGTPIIPVLDAVQVQWASGGGQVENPTAQALRSNAEHNYQFVRQTMHVRRLTPVECERLQGFPDGWTDIKPGGKDTPDSPRYKALGNSMAVPVMAWIGRRIEAHK